MDNLSYQSFNPLQNLKGFVLSRPPVLVFLICLITFAATALSLAYFVRTSDLKDPDVEYDWNILLEKFANLNFCLNTNKTLISSQLNTQNDLINSKKIDSNNSVSILVEFQFGREIENLNENITSITGIVCGKFLGLKGESAINEYKINLELPTNCQKECKRSVCITFYGLPVVPNVVPNMKSCSIPDLMTLSVNSTDFAVQRCSVLDELTCQSDVLRIGYTNNPNWSVMLSEHDKILINFHLMYTSYFLLLMVMTLLCYAVIRGRPKNKLFSPEKVHFDS